MTTTSTEKATHSGPGFTEAHAAWEKARDAFDATEDDSEAEAAARGPMDDAKAAMTAAPARTIGEAAMKARVIADHEWSGTLDIKALALGLAADLDRLAAPAA